MKKKLLHVVTSLDSPAVERMLDGQEPDDETWETVVCTVESPRPRRRRRSIAEVMTIQDGIGEQGPHSLINELRRLDQKLVADRQAILSRLKNRGVGVVSAERRHRFDITTAMRVRWLLRRYQPDAIQTWDDAAARWIDTAARNLSVPIDHAVSRTEIRSDVETVRLRIDGAHGLTRQQLLSELRLPSNAKLIGAIGPLIARRRIKDLIWALELLRIVDDDCYLLIAGHGPDEWRLHRFRDQVGVRHRVRFLGHRSDYLRWLPHLDYFWAGSKGHDDPTEVVHALGAGVPTVATDLPEFRQYITSGQNGYLVKPGDRAAFARHTWRMLNDAVIRRDIGEAGRASISDAVPQRFDS